MGIDITLLQYLGYGCLLALSTWIHYMFIACYYKNMEEEMGGDWVAKYLITALDVCSIVLLYMFVFIFTTNFIVICKVIILFIISIAGLFPFYYAGKKLASIKIKLDFGEK